jgi:hypothetical protein
LLPFCFYANIYNIVHRYATEVREKSPKERNFTYLVKEQPYENSFRTLSKK